MTRNVYATGGNRYSTNTAPDGFDPVGEKGCFNLYAFVRNAPINSYDSLGEFPNPFVPQPPPPNNIDPPPHGPFSKCSIALKCGNTVSGEQHCGLVVGTGDGVFEIDGSGGTTNQRFVTPGSRGSATGPWKSNPNSVCDCIFGSIKPWND
jgi:hypothetical protein